VANPVAHAISACALCRRAVYAAHVDGTGRCVFCRPLPPLTGNEVRVSLGTGSPMVALPAAVSATAELISEEEGEETKR